MFKEIILNINLLFFSFSYVWAFHKTISDHLDFRDRIRKVESVLSLILRIFGYKSMFQKKKTLAFVVFSIFLFLFTIGFVGYFYLFYVFVDYNYIGDLLDIIRLCITSFIFLLLPLFLFTSLDTFILCYFPDDIFSDVKDKKIKNKLKKNEIFVKNSKFEFWLEIIWIFSLIDLLTLILTFGYSGIWLFCVLIGFILIFCAIWLRVIQSKIDKNI